MIWGLLEDSLQEMKALFDRFLVKHLLNLKYRKIKCIDFQSNDDHFLGHFDFIFKTSPYLIS